MTHRRIALVVNPASGLGRAARVARQVADRLGADATVEVHEGRSPDESAELLAGVRRPDGNALRIARIDADTTRLKGALESQLAQVHAGEVDVLVGTQMVAKGHDFPGVTLVCVVMADTSLAIPDFRASERTFHLLTQVGGRAGRGKDPGRVLVQTYNPDSEPIQRVLAHDYDGFSETELRWRKALAYPPYTRMAAIRIEGEHPEQTAQVARDLANRMAQRMPPASQGVRLLGPAPAPIARIKGKTRWQVLLKGPTHGSIAPLLSLVEARLEDVPSAVKVVIDVDPTAML